MAALRRRPLAEDGLVKKKDILCEFWVNSAEFGCLSHENFELWELSKKIPWNKRIRKSSSEIPGNESNDDDCIFKKCLYP
jgi:hypothetical protein